MIITILYSLWIAYTVGSLSVIGFLAILSILGNIEKKKRGKQLAEMMKHEYKDTDW